VHPGILNREVCSRARRRAWRLAQQAYERYRDAILADVAEGLPVHAVDEWVPPAVGGSRPDVRTERLD